MYPLPFPSQDTADLWVKKAKGGLPNQTPAADTGNENTPQTQNSQFFGEGPVNPAQAPKPPKIGHTPQEVFIGSVWLPQETSTSTIQQAGETFCSLR